MRLDLASFPVSDARFDERTRYEDGVLEISKQELLSLVFEDARVASADLDIVFPGEQTRIVNVRSAAEPRVKVSGPGCVFPGILGPVETVGQGRTNRMAGVAVIHSAEYQPTVTAGTGAQGSGVLDMWGPGAELTPLGSTINLVLASRLVGGLTEVEAHSAIQLAECKIARRVAETTRDSDSGIDNIEIFELGKADPSLPRIVYILSFLTEWHLPPASIAYYGLPIWESLPTLVHPNEFFDGAITTDARKGHSSWPLNWRWMNQPVVLELMREHGKSLNFLGVILQRAGSESEFGKMVAAASASNMAKLLGADNAIITRINPAGISLVDAMLTVQACEKKGIKTVFLTPEACGSDGTGPSFFFTVPEATAMVSTGNLNIEPQMPAPKKVIGCEKGQTIVLRPGVKPIYPWGAIKLDRWTEISEGVDWFGGTKAMCVAY
ncbi:MAG: hypothetical protein HY675_18650 [Chloroflexi bacterium]|nr:hypothetical protein [Chloroflexota bacterium]